MEEVGNLVLTTGLKTLISHRKYHRNGRSRLLMKIKITTMITIIITMMIIMIVMIIMMTFSKAILTR